MMKGKGIGKWTMELLERTKQEIKMHYAKGSSS